MIKFNQVLFFIFSVDDKLIDINPSSDNPDEKYIDATLFQVIITIFIIPLLWLIF
jgi:hypothetical protein